MPRLVHITGYGFLILRVADDIAVFPGVCGDPTSLRGISEGLFEAIKVEGEARLVLRVTGAGGVSVCGGFAVLCHIVIIEGGLSLVASEAGGYPKGDAVILCGGEHLIKRRFRLRVHSGIVIRGKCVGLIGDEDAVYVGGGLDGGVIVDCDCHLRKDCRVVLGRYRDGAGALCHAVDIAVLIDRGDGGIVGLPDLVFILGIFRVHGHHGHLFSSGSDPDGVSVKGDIGDCSSCGHGLGRLRFGCCGIGLWRLGDGLCGVGDVGGAFGYA